MIVYVVDTYSEFGNYREPSICSILRGLSDWQIVTDEPTAQESALIIPDPNILVLSINGEQSIVDAIVAHPDYGEGAILYDEPNPYSPNGTPEAAEFGKRRSYCAKLGISQARFNAMFGTQANPKTRKTGADNLIAWCKTLPKGQAK